MTYLDDPVLGMTSITCKKGDYVLLELEHVVDFKKRCPEIYEELIESAAFVNWRNVDEGKPPTLMLSFYK